MSFSKVRYFFLFSVEFCMRTHTLYCFRRDVMPTVKSFNNHISLFFIKYTRHILCTLCFCVCLIWPAHHQSAKPMTNESCAYNFILSRNYHSTPQTEHCARVSMSLHSICNNVFALYIVNFDFHLHHNSYSVYDIKTTSSIPCISDNCATNKKINYFYCF